MPEPPPSPRRSPSRRLPSAGPAAVRAAAGCDAGSAPRVAEEDPASFRPSRAPGRPDAAQACDRAPRRDETAARRLRALYRDAHLRLFTLPKPTVAMVAGHAIAGGLVLVLACDYRLGLDADYRIGLNEVAIGASYPKVAFEIVRLRLAHARASELGAALYPASQALRLGVVDELLLPDGFAATVLRRAARLGSFPREAYAHTKAALVAEAVGRVEAETPEEAARGAAVWATAESRAARAAQRAKLGMR